MWQSCTLDFVRDKQRVCGSVNFRTVNRLLTKPEWIWLLQLSNESELPTIPNKNSGSARNTPRWMEMGLHQLFVETGEAHITSSCLFTGRLKMYVSYAYTGDWQFHGSLTNAADHREHSYARNCGSPCRGVSGSLTDMGRGLRLWRHHQQRPGRSTSP